MTENDAISSNNGDSNNNDSSAAVVLKPRRYRIPKRELAKKEVRRLKIEECLTNAEITATTGIPDKSIRRYLQEIYAQENDVLQHPTSEELACDVAIFKEKATRQIRQVLEIANDKNCEADMRLAAHDWALNAEWVLLKLSYQSLTDIARQLNLSSAIKFIESQQQEQQTHRPSLEQFK